MIVFCLFQFCSLFLKKYNISPQVWPAARAPRHVPVQLLASVGPGCGGAAPGVTLLMDSPCPLCCCCCGQPGALRWPSGGHRGPGCPCWPAAVAWGARADQRPGLTSGCGLSPVPRPAQPLWPERPAEAAASGSTHPADNISGEKGNLFIFSAQRWCFALGVKCTCAVRAQSVHGSAGGAARRRHGARRVSCFVRWKQAGSNPSTSCCQHGLCHAGRDAASAAQHQDEAITVKQEWTVQVLESSSVNNNWVQKFCP